MDEYKAKAVKTLNEQADKHDFITKFNTKHNLSMDIYTKLDSIKTDL